MEYSGLSWDFKTTSGECIQSIHSSIIFLDFCCYGMFKVIYSFLNFGGQDYVYLGERKKSFILDFGECNDTPLQYSCLENPMDWGAWWAAVHGVAKSQTRLSDFTFTFHFHVLEKEIAAHSGVLAWRIPETREPGGLPSMGLHRVGHDWSNLAAVSYDQICGGKFYYRNGMVLFIMVPNWKQPTCSSTG